MRAPRSVLRETSFLAPSSKDVMVSLVRVAVFWRRVQAPSLVGERVPADRPAGTDW